MSWLGGVYNLRWKALWAGLERSDWPREKAGTPGVQLRRLKKEVSGWVKRAMVGGDNPVGGNSTVWAGLECLNCARKWESE